MKSAKQHDPATFAPVEEVLKCSIYVKATENCFPVVLFTMPQVILILMKPSGVTSATKAVGQYSFVTLKLGGQNNSTPLFLKRFFFWILMPIWDSFSITTKRNVGKCSLIWLTLDGIPRRSPFGKVNSLLSSRTLFKFSTHSGSTSPSKMIHCRLLISPRTLSMILERRVIQLIKEASRWQKIPNILKVCCSGNKMFFKLNNDRTHFKKCPLTFLECVWTAHQSIPWC